jgi:NAD(P)-dependent dehydrogenase (short-subunit alcohol dehydrogenase family)
MRRVCLLTGAGGLLGSEFCIRLAATYDIVATYRSVPPPVASQDSELFDPLAPHRVVPESRHPVHAVQADLASPDEVDRVVELALARFGAVDLLVNAAADVGATTTTDPREADSWAEQLWLNTVVPVRLAAVLAQTCWLSEEHENRARRRDVVNVASTAGLGNAPGRGGAFYGASKAALLVLTRQMAAEYARFGVRVNAVAPTFFPQVVPTAQVLEAITALDGGGMTGEVLVLDGSAQDLKQVGGFPAPRTRGGHRTAGSGAPGNTAAQDAR